jgi:hypothetical protein
MIRTSTLILLVALTSVGCDRSEPETPEETEQKQKQSEGQVWRDLMSNLDGAEESQERVDLLDRFVTDYPDHPDITQARELLEEARADVERAEAFRKLRSAAADEKNADAVVRFFAADIAAQATRSSEHGELEEELTLATADGTRTFQTRLLYAPTHLRGRTRIALMEHMPDLVEKRCDQECVNNAINNLLQGTTGEPLFAEPGKMNRGAVEALFEKLPVSEDETVLGLPAARMYDLYRPTIRAFARTRDAVKSAGIEDAAARIEDADAREIKSFYRSFTTEHGIAEAVDLDEKTARAFASWWIRRWADGSGPVFDAKLDEVLETFDPEFTGAEQVEDAGEEK